MATELDIPEKHTDQFAGSLITDPWVEQKEKDLREAEKSLNALMKRMASAKAAMEKAQGTELYTRHAFAYDLASLEYKNAWQHCRIIKQDIFIHRLSEHHGYQQQALDLSTQMLHDFHNRLKVLERAFAKMDDPRQFGFEKFKQGYTLGLKRADERDAKNGGENGSTNAQ